MGGDDDLGDYRATLTSCFGDHYRSRKDTWSAEPIQDAVFAVIERSLGDRRLRILDIGCGNGRDSRRMASRGHDVLGLDIIASPSWDRLSAANPGLLAFEKTFFQDFETDQRFDLIVDNGCLHHQQQVDLLPYLIRIASLLAPRGSLVVCVFDDDAPRGCRIDDDGRVYHNFAPEELSTMLCDAGLTVDDAVTLVRARQGWRYRVLTCRRAEVVRQ